MDGFTFAMQLKINYISWIHFAPKGLFIFGSANQFSPRPVDVCDRLDDYSDWVVTARLLNVAGDLTTVFSLFSESVERVSEVVNGYRYKK